LQAAPKASAAADPMQYLLTHYHVAILQVFSNYQAIASRTFSVSLIVEFLVSAMDALQRIICLNGV
jgi:hypothetical protein